jgi:rhodanese-related sulfurtransferase
MTNQGPLGQSWLSHYPTPPATTCRWSLCQEGYTSSLAADALRGLGLHQAADVIGGFAAWELAGLPVTR